MGQHSAEHFAPAAAKDRTVVLYGKLEWHEYLHSVMFAAHGYSVLYVNGGVHGVARVLRDLPGNALAALLKRFADFNSPFTLAPYRAC